MTITMIRNREPSKFCCMCDFCAATQDEAKLLISSPNGSHICDLCVAECMAVVSGKRNEATA